VNAAEHVTAHIAEHIAGPTAFRPPERLEK